MGWNEQEAVTAADHEAAAARLRAADAHELPTPALGRARRRL